MGDITVVPVGLGVENRVGRPILQFICGQTTSTIEAVRAQGSALGDVCELACGVECLDLVPPIGSVIPIRSFLEL